MKLEDLARGQVILVGASYRQVAEVLVPRDPRAEMAGMVAVGWHVWHEADKRWSGYTLRALSADDVRGWSPLQDAAELFPNGLPVAVTR